MLSEYPWSSNLAQLLALLSLAMVLLSTITFIISTADELQVGVGQVSRWQVVDLKPKLTED